ncbi:FabD/lysophospholipase-like protein [Myriangium duriaei CBS 260.36]|uniref:FabD/lysophospholipase-like protein n=1 Tax=Myriangium duriaei CBS 260.36 TaxID=1168546 RepID=A0A9P4IX10_9PEZI|nr:FabD/lysophospholipase-like protein [Myriangium duriaei CBS 260.36]
MTGQQLKLLCIDGGGVKGLSALFILRKLMEFIDPDDPPKPCDYFDLIGGTSTGGLIAIMLGRLEMSVDECIEQYLILQDKIFKRKHLSPVGCFGGVQGRYDHTALEDGVKSLLRSKGLEENALFKNPNKMACKVFVTATTAGAAETDVLASYYRPRGAAELYNTAKIWEVARATSAASTFFEPISIGQVGRRFLDGGTGANNPVFVLWTEALNLYCQGTGTQLDDDLNCLVSIGCGLRALRPFGESASGLMKTLAGIATETEATAKSFLETRPHLYDAGKYHRFSAPSVGDIAMDKPEEKGVISQQTDHYIAAYETQGRMLLCTKKLPQRESTSQYH